MLHELAERAGPAPVFVSPPPVFLPREPDRRGAQNGGPARLLLKASRQRNPSSDGTGGRGVRIGRCARHAGRAGPATQHPTRLPGSRSCVRSMAGVRHGSVGQMVLRVGVTRTGLLPCAGRPRAHTRSRTHAGPPISSNGESGDQETRANTGRGGGGDTPTGAGAARAQTLRNTEGPARPPGGGR